jgi:hypothetical protein
MTVATNQSSATTETTGKQRNGADIAPACYVPRHLRITDDKEQMRLVDESELLARVGPKIVLGEPGMGKSELIDELGRKLGVQPIAAIRFMLSKNPSGFVVAGKPLLVDGLDEAMARREGDAVDLILAQLENAGSPDFILSCRAREWQTRSVTNLRQLYGAYPAIFTLEPLSRYEASAFLAQRFPKVDPEHVISHLDMHGISELYSNPLTLGMMGQVAQYDAHLPATRAALFERVCTLIWPEHDLDRQDSSLGKITEDQALSASGAIMAGLLLAGADAASLSIPAQLADGDVRLADLETLPGANAARAVFSSKLFHGAGVGRAKPIHRVIAEFLGARWLAQQVVTTRARRRLLAQLHGTGAVPASLRGLHAWLAFHSSPMAQAVIAADPYGVLRYGETASLNTEQANCMFDALHALALVDPYFRSGDLNSHKATVLMIPNLRTKIEATITSSGSNYHLRSLLIEGLKGTPLAVDLADTLESVMLSTERFYGEREHAAEALSSNRSRDWWRQAIANLHDQGTEDSTRLARRMIEMNECDVSDNLLVATLLAELGVTICSLPRIKTRRVSTVRYYDRIVGAVSTERLINVLNLLCGYAPLLKPTQWQKQSDLAQITTSFIVSAIDKNAVHPGNPELLWHWLGILLPANHLHREETQPIQERLDAHDELRRAVQLHALYEERPRPTILMSEIDLEQRMVGLARRPNDVTWFLERLSGCDNKNASLREDWCDLMRLGLRCNGSDPELRPASRKFQNGDAQLEAFVYKLENPKKPAWEVKQARDAAKREKKKSIAYETRRRYYNANKASLRAGELGAILDPAKVYLGLFYDQDRKQPSTNRLSEWLGIEIAADALAGLEAVLHRSDIPSSTDVANGFAKNTVWNYCFAIMAGLLARQRAGQGFADLPADVRTTGLLLCYNDLGMRGHDDLPTFRDELEQTIINTAKDREDFARLWIEPSISAGISHISALYKLAHDKRWHATGAILAAEWLSTSNKLPINIELDLVDCLTHSGALEALVSIATEREDVVFHDDEHMFGWLAIDVLVRFDKVLPQLSGIGDHHPNFIWFLRDRFQLERRGTLLQVSVAQARWIVSEFRSQWPYATLEGSGTGNTNPYDATDFLRAMINRIADDTTVEATEAIQVLISELTDSYTDVIRNMKVEQRQKRAEEDFTPVTPKYLGALLTEGPPSNADDLKSLVLEELMVAQKVLIGDDVDQVRDFWSDAGVPYDENRCRDRLTAMIGPELMRYDVQRITEADMPKTKRADLAFARGQLQIPMEVKGQWHPKVWQAATDQLDLKYLVDWRSEQRGIYCVLWFGTLPSSSGRRLQAHPSTPKAPDSANEMRKMLIERIPETRRALIDVVVLDLTAGSPSV